MRLAALFGLPCVLASIGGADATPVTYIERGIAVLGLAETRRVSIGFEDAPIKEVLRQIERDAQIPMAVDWSALRSLGIRPDDTISFERTDVTVADLLTAIGIRIGTEHEKPVVDAAGDQLVFTTLDASAALRTTDVYDLRGLLGNATVEGTLRGELEERDAAQEAASPSRETMAPEKAKEETDDAEEHANTSAGEPLREPDEPRPDAPSRRPIHPVVSMIVEHVDPEGWVGTMGVRGRIDERAGLLYVTTTPRVHRQIRELVARLRALRPPALAFEATLCSLPRSVFASVRGAHGSGASVALAAALLASTDKSVLWEASEQLALGASTESESKSERSGSSEHIRFLIAPAQELLDGLCPVTIEVEYQLGSAIRKVKTTVPIAIDKSAAVIEVAGATSAGEAIVLVLRTGAGS